jgi:hypothetical protein
VNGKKETSTGSKSLGLWTIKQTAANHEAFTEAGTHWQISIPASNGFNAVICKVVIDEARFIAWNEAGSSALFVGAESR